MASDGERRRRAADLFNLVWKLLEKPDRTRQDDELMVHAAHASRFYWGESGTAKNWARGDWQLSRVYATLGRAEPALHHAERCLEVCLDHPDEMEPFDLPYAYEALARGHAVAGDGAELARWAELGRAACNDINGDDDREMVLTDLQTLPAPTARP